MIFVFSASRSPRHGLRIAKEIGAWLADPFANGEVGKR
jgi:hypothetical protein